MSYGDRLCKNFVKAYHISQKKKYAAYDARRITPPHLKSFFFLKHNNHNNTPAPIAISVSTLKGTVKGILVMSPDIPTTKRILNILLPTTFPTAISALPFLAAVTDVNNSGSDVPRATTVRPIKRSLTPKLLAISVAAFTVI